MKTTTKLTHNNIRRIVRLYTKEAVSTIRLADEYGVAPSTIARALREAGVELKSRGRYPQAA